jgi:hypothetical protein
VLIYLQKGKQRGDMDFNFLGMLPWKIFNEEAEMIKGIKMTIDLKELCSGLH